MYELVFLNSSLQAKQTETALQQVNHRVEGYGLTLAAAEICWLAGRHVQTLQATGRVEFGQGVLSALAFAFCDSPYIAPTDYAATLDALMECFYTYKNETLEAVSDDELLAFMQQQFNGSCHGSLECLQDRLHQLAHDVHFTGFSNDEAEDDAEAGDEQEADDE